MPRIQLWADRLWPHLGGIERMTQLMASALQARGHEVEIVTQRFDEEPFDEHLGGVPVVRLTAITPENVGVFDVVAGNLARTRRSALRFRPDIRLLMQPFALLGFYSLAQAAAPALTVFSLRGRMEETWAADHPVGRAMRSCDYLVSCSTRMLDAARAQMPEIVPRSMTILNALPAPAVEPAPLPWDAPRFLCLGRLGYQKNVAAAIRAFASLAERLPTARLVVAGDGPEAEMLRALADSSGAAGRIDFIGRVAASDVPDVINRATAVLMPSLFEGLPQVALQAMQMARPLLVSRVDGLAEAVLDGETGFLFEVGDEAALAAAMLHLLDNREAATALGQAGRRRARALFDWDHYMQAYDALFRQLLAVS